MEKVVKRASSGFPVLLLTGMRQIGKSTLMQTMAESKRGYVSLDDAQARELAKKDPRRFIQENPPPVIIDEVQYAPELFPYIKIWADEHKLRYLQGKKSANPKGAFWLTGSQKFRLMEGVRESLAGRVAVLDMLGLSWREMTEKPEGGPFLPGMESGRKRTNSNRTTRTSPGVFDIIWRGSFPELVTDRSIDRKMFYDSFIQTYITRDVKDFYNIHDDLSFYNFLVAAAARTGEILNYQNFADDVHIDYRTAKLWLSILERSGIIHLLYPYSRNIGKRIIRSPKLYFLDTGLASYLTRWHSPESLASGAQGGHMLETWVFTEILKSYQHNGEQAGIYFYRDSNKVEIDFLIERNGTLYPIEVKKTTLPNTGDAKNFKALEDMPLKTGHGAVVCLAPKAGSLPALAVSITPVWDI
jgi:predicted AAA+ superfamily ATPase